MTKQDTSIAKKQDFSVEALISQAISSNATVDTMERLMAMRRELKEEYAKRQFDLSMTEFQASCPVIVRKKGVETNSGKIAYRYAPLEDIVEQTKELIQKHGFSYGIVTETTDKGVLARCVVRHIDGHSESSDFSVPLGTRTALMSPTQQVAAAITFAKRYAFCNAFGIMTGDEDVEQKTEEVDQEAVQEAIDKIGDAKTIDDLKSVYAGLGKLKLVRSIVQAKDKRKEELSNEDN